MKERSKRKKEGGEGNGKSDFQSDYIAAFKSAIRKVKSQTRGYS